MLNGDLQYKNKFPQKGQQLKHEPKKKKKDTNLSVHRSTNIQSDQATKFPLNVLQWIVCVLVVANHILWNDAIWHPLLPVYRKKRKPLAREINSHNSILCSRAHKGPHKYCQIIFHGTILLPTCTAYTEESFAPCLGMTQFIPTHEEHGTYWLLLKDLNTIMGLRKIKKTWRTKDKEW